MAKGSVTARRSPQDRVDLLDPALYINRELSWVRFNRRVLEEAIDPSHPLLERLKFLAIWANNLDEFFMVRVSGLLRQVETGAVALPADGMSPTQQLAGIRRELLPDITRHAAAWADDIQPALAEAGVEALNHADLTPEERRGARRYFRQHIFPILTPLAFDPSHPFPHISNLSLNLAVVLDDKVHGERFARLKIPQETPRLIPSSLWADGNEENGANHNGGAKRFVWNEQLVIANLKALFPGIHVEAAYPFRVTRDADLEIREDDAADLADTVEAIVGRRHFGSVVRLQADARMPPRVRSILIRNLGVDPQEVYDVHGPLGLADLMQLHSLDRPELKDPPITHVTPAPLIAGHDLFSAARHSDVLLFHPFDSIGPVVDFIRGAARDPNVLAIKQTLYRIGRNSPIVEALQEARENGKQVAVLVELKARFDEENNIAWARALEAAGVHVVYGVAGLKTHAKLLLVVRRERGKIVRYVHLSTGNYNTQTARIYTDLGLITRDSAIGQDVSELFNALTGYSARQEYRKLLVAPGNMRRELLSRIERETRLHKKAGGGHLAFKMNALVDEECIRALYRASQAGVKVDLQVRGVCCLRPGAKGVSENITVTSVVGRFLEHARIYYFRNGGKEEVLIGSADLMPRNLDRRVEVLFPVDDAARKKDLIELLGIYMRDNLKARQMGVDGTYHRVLPKPGDPKINSQVAAMRLRERAGREGARIQRREGRRASRKVLA